MRTLALLAALGAAVFPTLSWAADPDPDAEIAALLDFVAASGCEMLRNGTAHRAPEARGHLERKLAVLRERDPIASAEDFIELAASRSSLSGRAYLVRCDGSPEQPSQRWLSSELVRLRATHDPSSGPQELP